MFEYYFPQKRALHMKIYFLPVQIYFVQNNTIILNLINAILI